MACSKVSDGGQYYYMYFLIIALNFILQNLACGEGEGRLWSFFQIQINVMNGRMSGVPFAIISPSNQPSLTDVKWAKES